LVIPAFGLAINIDQPSIRITLKPGETKTGALTVLNIGSTNLKIKAYTEDWKYAPDGSKDFMKAGSSVYSCSNWISLEAQAFDLGPRDTKTVTYKITAPKNASGSHVSVIFFEAVVGTVEGIAVTGRIGSIMYQDTEGYIKKEAQIKSFTVTPSVEGQPVAFDVFLVNKGNSYVSTRPKLTIFKDDKEIMKKDMNPINMLPGDDAEGKVVLNSPMLKEGSYKAQIDISYEDKTLQSKSDFSIKKI